MFHQSIHVNKTADGVKAEIRIQARRSHVQADVLIATADVDALKAVTPAQAREVLSQAVKSILTQLTP